MAGKDVENKLGAIHHPHGQCVFKVPELGGGEVVIEEDQGGLCRFRDRGDLFHLAFANQRGRVRPGPALQHFGDNFGPRTGDQLAKFCEGRTVLDAAGAMSSWLAASPWRVSGELGGFRASAAERGNACGRETNSTPTSSARSA